MNSIIQQEDFKIFKRVAMICLAIGLLILGMSLVQGNINSQFMGAAFSLLSIICFLLIRARKVLAAKLLWAFFIPLIVLLSCVIHPVEYASSLFTYGYALSGGAMYVLYSFEEDEKSYAWLSVLLFSAATIFYDVLLYRNAVHPEEFLLYEKYYRILKLFQLVHFLALLYLMNLAKQHKQSIQEKISDQLNRLSRYTSSLIGISANPSVFSGLLEESLYEVARHTSQVLGVSRVSIWRYDKFRNSISYIGGYNCDNVFNVNKTVIPLDDFPTYAKAITEQRIVCADDARTSPLTRELEQYLEVHGILSMMDCPIIDNGKYYGIICCEEQECHRHWDDVDQLFCQAMTHMITISLRFSEQLMHSNEMSLLNKQLESQNTVLKEINDIIRSQSRSEMNAQNIMEGTTHFKQTMSEYSFKNSHQVRGPLARILGLISLYKKDDSVQNREVYVQHMENSIKELDEIIKQVSLMLAKELHIDGNSSAH